MYTGSYGLIRTHYFFHFCNVTTFEYACVRPIYILKIHRRGEAAVARVICYVFHSKTDGGQRTGRVMAAARILPPRGGGEFERRTEEENPGAENYKVTTILYLYNTLSSIVV